MASGNARGTAAQARVLVVDDYQDLADSLTLMLRALGADARAAYDGLSAIQMAESFLPDVAFLDLGLPGLTGFDVAQTLSGIPALHGLTLVAVSGWSHDDARRHSAEAGFHEYVLKPVTIETLERILDKYVPSSNSRTAI